MRRNQKRGMSNLTAGVLALTLMAVATYFGFTKAVPFRQHYEVEAVFRSANNIRTASPVRIAGVNVGEVVGIERIDGDAQASVVRMRIQDKGLPIHRDAEVAIRPRIFLEGNFFVDLDPGSPSAPTVGDGERIPINQTSAPVQLDQVLTSLQKDTRKDLQLLLEELSTGLDKSGARGFNRSIRWWEPAYRDGAIVAEAQLGERPHDLSRYLKSAGQVAAALDRNPVQLKELITDFNVTARSLAREQEALSQAIVELPRLLRAGNPALAALNDAFPAVRRLVADFRPGVRSSLPALRASTPLVEQLRGLMRPSELRGLVADLRPTVPALTELNTNTKPLYEQVRAGSSCQNEVILPWTKDTIEDKAHPAVGPVYVESTKPLGGLAGESRSGDANGQWFRVMLTGGNYTYPAGADRFIQSTFPLLGANPPPPAYKSPYRPDVPCETQQQPDLRSVPAAIPGGRQVRVTDQEGWRKLQESAEKTLKDSLREQGAPSSALKQVDQMIEGLGK